MESEHLNGSASGVALAEQEALTSPFTESASTEGEAGPEARARPARFAVAEAIARQVRSRRRASSKRSPQSWRTPRSRRESNDSSTRPQRCTFAPPRRGRPEAKRSTALYCELESWFESLAGEADRLLEHLEAEFGSRTPESLAEGELEAAGEAYFAEHATEHPATEQFLGGLIKKAVKLAKGVHSIVKRGVSAIGNLLPMGKLFGGAASTGEPTAAACPPHRDQQVAGVSSRAGVAAREEAPRRARESVGGRGRRGRIRWSTRRGSAPPNEAEADHALREMEAEVEAPLDRYDAAGELDRARARLVDQLMGGSAGEAPTAEVEEVIPW